MIYRYLQRFWLVFSVILSSIGICASQPNIQSISGINFSNSNNRICSHVVQQQGIQLSLSGSNLGAVSTVSWRVDVPFTTLPGGTNFLSTHLTTTATGTIIVSATVNGTIFISKTITVDATIPTVLGIGRQDNSPVCSNGQNIVFTVNGTNASRYEWYYATSSNLPNVFSLVYKGVSSTTSFNFITTPSGAIDVFAVGINESCADTLNFSDRYVLQVNNLPTISSFRYGQGRGPNQDLFCKGNMVTGLTSSIEVRADTTIAPVIISDVTGYSYPYAYNFSTNTAGIALHTLSGVITIPSSNIGTYVVQCSIVSIPGCPAVTATTTLTIQQLPSVRPNLSYPNTQYCTNQADSIVPSYTANGYDISTIRFSAGSPSLRINSITGSIFPRLSEEANYKVNFTVNGLGGCSNIKMISDSTLLSIRDSAQGYSFSYFDSFDRVTACKTGLEYPKLYKYGIEVTPPPGAYFKNFDKTGVAFSNNDSVIGRLDMELLEPNRVYELGFYVPASAACSAIFLRGFILSVTSDSLVSPPIDYGSDLFCLQDSKNASLQKIELVAPPTIPGTFKVFNAAGLTTNFMQIDARTGTLDYANRGPIPTDLKIEFTPDPPASNCKFRPSTFRLNFRRRSVSEFTIPLDQNIATQCLDNSPIEIRHTLTGGHFIASPAGLVWQDSVAGIVNNTATQPNRRYNIFYRVPESRFCSEAIGSPFTLNAIKSVGGRVAPVGFRLEDGVCEGNTFTLTVTGTNGRFLGWIVRTPTSDFQTIRDNAGDPIATSLLEYTVAGEDLEIEAANRLDPCVAAFSNRVTIKRFELTRSGFIFPQYKELCNDTTLSEIYIQDHLGTVMWQFSKDSLGRFDTLQLADGTPQLDSVALSKPTFNYGEKYFYRALVKNGPCPFRPTNIIGIGYCNPSSKAPNVFAPTSFDPNVARWRLDGMRLRDEATIEVYNRYGALVHQMTGLDAKRSPWDGSGLPAGTYWYVIDRKDGSKPITGSVSIIR